jgi:hypothetical protein
VNLCRADLSILKVIWLLCIAITAAGVSGDGNSEARLKPLKNRRPEARPDDEIPASADFSGVERRDSRLLREKFVLLDL